LSLTLEEELISPSIPSHGVHTISISASDPSAYQVDAELWQLLPSSARLRYSHRRPQMTAWTWRLHDYEGSSGRQGPQLRGKY
jgi:hypothetical protein